MQKFNPPYSIPTHRKCIYYHCATFGWIRYTWVCKSRKSRTPPPAHNAIEYNMYLACRRKVGRGFFPSKVLDISVSPTCPNAEQLMIMNEIVYSLHVCGPQAMSHGSGDDLSGIREERGWWFNFAVLRTRLVFRIKYSEYFSSILNNFRLLVRKVFKSMLYSESFGQYFEYFIQTTFNVLKFNFCFNIYCSNML